MKKPLIVTALFTLSLLAGAHLAVRAQGYALGAPVQAFTLKDASGKSIQLAELAGAKAVVVVFTNPLCPYTKLYENRLVTLMKDGTGQNVKYLFINPVAGPPPTSQQQLAATGAETRLGDYPYLVDEGLKVTRAFGASKTPEAFVLQPSGGQFVLRYRGAIDDNPQVEGDVRARYLRDAVQAVAAGQVPKTAEQRAAGCMIKGL